MATALFPVAHFYQHCLLLLFPNNPSGNNKLTSGLQPLGFMETDTYFPLSVGLSLFSTLSVISGTWEG